MGAGRGGEVAGKKLVFVVAWGSNLDRLTGRWWWGAEIASDGDPWQSRGALQLRWIRPWKGKGKGKRKELGGAARCLLCFALPCLSCCYPHHERRQSSSSQLPPSPGPQAPSSRLPLNPFYPAVKTPPRFTLPGGPYHLPTRLTSHPPTYPLIYLPTDLPRYSLSGLSFLWPCVWVVYEEIEVLIWWVSFWRALRLFGWRVGSSPRCRSENIMETNRKTLYLTWVRVNYMGYGFSIIMWRMKNRPSGLSFSLAMGAVYEEIEVLIWVSFWRAPRFEPLLLKGWFESRTSIWEYDGKRNTKLCMELGACELFIRGMVLV